MSRGPGLRGGDMTPCSKQAIGLVMLKRRPFHVPLYLTEYEYLSLFASHLESSEALLGC